MTIEQKRRELFGREYSKLDQQAAAHLLFVRDDGQYGYHTTRTAWACFNAALDAVVIELPEPEPFEISAEESLDMDPEELEELEARNGAQYSTYRKCRAAIESTGLGLKVLP